MVAVFGGFIFSESTIIRSLGFGLASRTDAAHACAHAPSWEDCMVDPALARQDHAENADVEAATLERRHHLDAPAAGAPVKDTLGPDSPRG